MGDQPRSSSQGDATHTHTLLGETAGSGHTWLACSQARSWEHPQELHAGKCKRCGDWRSRTWVLSRCVCIWVWRGWVWGGRGRGGCLPALEEGDQTLRLHQGRGEGRGGKGGGKVPAPSVSERSRGVLWGWWGAVWLGYTDGIRAVGQQHQG